jgi:hypothetical protein
MKRFPLAPVVSMLCLALFATSAAAECAWVLWEDTILAKNKTSTEPVRAYTTKPDCDHALSNALLGSRVRPASS